MLDFTIISAAPIGFFVFGILATLLVAISKAGLARDGVIVTATHALVLSPGWLCRSYCRFSALRFLCRLEILSPCGAPYCHHHDFGRLFGAGLGWLLYKQINAEILMFIIGALAVFTATRYFWRLYHPGENIGLARVALRHLRRRMDRALGWMGLAGIASFISLTGGIPSQIYLRRSICRAPIMSARWAGPFCWSIWPNYRFSSNWGCLTGPADR